MTLEEISSRVQRARPVRDRVRQIWIWFLAAVAIAGVACLFTGRDLWSLWPLIPAEGLLLALRLIAEAQFAKAERTFELYMDAQRSIDG